MKKILSFVLFFSIVISMAAKPPKPPMGYRWVLNTKFSDEFDGDNLDPTKWMNRFNGGWEGRAPGWFNPDAVSVGEGNLKITSGMLDEPKGRNGQYTMYGGAVSSVTKEAHFGYYECKAKASKIAMSTTFWMSNDKVPFTENDDCDDDSYSQELDIQEAVGGSTTFDKFKNGMNCNTHFRYVKCGEKRETFISRGTGTKLHSEVSDDFHIYGAWWMNEREVMFFANDEVFDTVMVRTDISQKPFDRPMQINMVTETYDWQPAPSAEDLENEEINTALYDWVRSYKLIPISSKNTDKHSTNLYENLCDVEASVDKGNLAVEYEYELNEDAKLSLDILDSNGLVLDSKIISLLKGYGYNIQNLKISKRILGKAKSVKMSIVSTTSNDVNIQLSQDI